MGRGKLFFNDYTNFTKLPLEESNTQVVYPTTFHESWAQALGNPLLL